jgi:hypothetical protein
MGWWADSLVKRTGAATTTTTTTTTTHFRVLFWAPSVLQKTNSTSKVMWQNSFLLNTRSSLSKIREWCGKKKRSPNSCQKLFAICMLFAYAGKHVISTSSLRQLFKTIQDTNFEESPWWQNLRDKPMMLLQHLSAIPKTTPQNNSRLSFYESDWPL